MTYEAWRCTFQSSEQAARAAFDKVREVSAKLDKVEERNRSLLADRAALVVELERLREGERNV